MASFLAVAMTARVATTAERDPKRLWQAMSPKWHPTDADCPKCKGSGDCPDCNGSGMTTPKHPCRRCSGSGKCQNCWGRGYV